MDTEGAQKYFHLLILELINFSKNSYSVGDLQAIDSTFHEKAAESKELIYKRRFFLCKGIYLYLTRPPS